MIPCDYIISDCVGKAVAYNSQKKLCRDGQVSLLDGSLSINRQVQGHPPLGGLSQRWLTQELVIFNNLPSVVKLSGEKGLVGINILVIQIPADAW